MSSQGFPFINEVHPTTITEFKDRAKASATALSVFARFRSNAVYNGTSGIILTNNNDYKFSDSYSPLVTTAGKRIVQSRLTAGAGIKEVNVETTGDNGMLFKATITWYCGSKEQLEYLSNFFMVPGITAAVDWGWVNPRKTSVFNTTNPLPLNVSTTTIAEMKKIMSNGGFDYLFDTYYIKNRGNYGLVVGYISDYSFRLNEDNSYECTTVLMSLGHAGLYKRTKNIEQNQNWVSTSQSIVTQITSIQKFFADVCTDEINFKRVFPDAVPIPIEITPTNPGEILPYITTNDTSNDVPLAATNDRIYMRLSDMLYYLYMFSGQISKTTTKAQFCDSILSNASQFVIFSDITKFKSQALDSVLFSFENLPTKQKTASTFYFDPGAGRIARPVKQYYIEDKALFLNTIMISLESAIAISDETDNLFDLINRLLGLVSEATMNWWDLKWVARDGQSLSDFHIINAKEIVKSSTTNKFIVNSFVNPVATEPISLETNLPADLANSVISNRLSQDSLRYRYVGQNNGAATYIDDLVFPLKSVAPPVPAQAQQQSDLDKQLIVIEMQNAFIQYEELNPSAASNKEISLVAILLGGGVPPARASEINAAYIDIFQPGKNLSLGGQWTSRKHQETTYWPLVEYKKEYRTSESGASATGGGNAFALVINSISSLSPPSNIPLYFYADRNMFLANVKLQTGTSLTNTYPIVNVNLTVPLPGSTGFHNGNKIYVDNIPTRFTGTNYNAYFIVTSISHNVSTTWTTTLGCTFTI